MLFSVVTASFYTPTQCTMYFIIYASSFSVPECEHPNGCEVMSHWAFDFHVSYDQLCWTTFHRLFGHLYISLEKFLFKSFAHFLVSTFLLLNCRCCLYIMDIKSYDIHNLKIFYRTAQVAFPLPIFLLMHQSFKFHAVPFVYFCFCCLCF